MKEIYKFTVSIIIMATTFLSLTAFSQAVIYGRGRSVYYYPGYYNYYINPYRPYYRPTTVIYPYHTDINSCPLQGSYYDAAGNWVPPTRVCPTPHR